MSFFNSYSIMLLNQKLAEINTAITNANKATGDMNTKLNELTNYDFETMTMGNYQLSNNATIDTLDVNYIK
jgi:hypothetical protein